MSYNVISSYSYNINQANQQIGSSNACYAQNMCVAPPSSGGSSSESSSSSSSSSGTSSSSGPSCRDCPNQCCE